MATKTMSVITSYRPEPEHIEELLQPYGPQLVSQGRPGLVGMGREWSIKSTISDAQLSVFLARGQVLDFVIWRVMFAYDEEHQADADLIAVRIADILRAENPDPTAVRLYGPGEDLPDAGWLIRLQSRRRRSPGGYGAEQVCIVEALMQCS